MHLEEKFPYGTNKDLGFNILHLPYKGEELSMMIMLPSDVSGLDALERQLSTEVLQNAIRDTETTEVYAALPKFMIEKSLELKPRLQRMGINDQFSKGADLSGVTTDVPLYVSEVFHRTFIEVNEEGTEAAAAAAFVGYGASEPTYFKADHPFLFGIFDCRTNIFLFWGKIANPASIDRANL